MSARDYGGTMMVVGKDGRWRIRIVTDNGLVVESRQVFSTVEEAKAHGIKGLSFVMTGGVRTETAQ